MTFPDGVNRLDDLLIDACRKYGAAPALIDSSQTTSYASLADRSGRLTELLDGALNKDDRAVLVAVSNHAEDFAAELAVWATGRVVIPVHRGAPTANVRSIAQRTGARYLLGEPIPRDWESLLVPAHSNAVPRALNEAVPATPQELDRDQALVIFTSGSTGRPKGVVLSHATFSGKLAANQRRLQFGPNESLLHLLHLNFSFGQWTSLLTLATGGQLHLVQRFDPAAAVKRLAASRVDRVPVVPSMLRLMLPLVSATENRRRLAEVASPGVWIAGGEPLSAGIGRRYRKSLPHAEMADVFGLSESATSDFVVTPAEYDAAAGTIGRPAEGVEAMVADQDGKPMPPGEFGELCLRTRFLMTGYLGDPDATRETIRSGWLRTGDLARIRSDNRFELGGRTKNLISRGGIKISPLEIESVYAEHPACAGVLAVGAPDDVLGERIHLLVVPSTSEGITLDAMRRWGRNHLEPYKLPDEIHLVNAIPLGNTGKADRLAAASLISGRNPAQS